MVIDTEQVGLIRVDIKRCSPAENHVIIRMGRGSYVALLQLFERVPYHYDPTPKQALTIYFIVFVQTNRRISGIGLYKISRNLITRMSECLRVSGCE